MGKKNTLDVRKLLIYVIAAAASALFVFVVMPKILSPGSSQAIEKSEAMVKNLAYSDLSIVADRFSSKIIYVKDDNYIVEVKFASNGGNWLGCYALRVYKGYVVDYTRMLHPDYNCKKHLEELKALFGIL